MEIEENIINYYVIGKLHSKYEYCGFIWYWACEIFFNHRDDEYETRVLNNNIKFDESATCPGKMYELKDTF